MLALLALAAAAAGPVDDRLVLRAPNLNGHAGLVRTTSALIGDTGTAALAFDSRFFAVSDFVLDGTDANTFVEGNVAAGLSFAELVEVVVASRGGANLNNARAQPVTSLGDTSVGLKAGYSFGLVATAAHYRANFASRANKPGFDLENIGSTFGADVTLDLLAVDVPVRVHLNGMYTAQPGQKAVDAEKKFLFAGPDGALLSLATQQWFWDRAGGGLGVEVPLPYVTPYVEAWYQAAVLAPEYDLGTDSWLIVTPGLRAGYGGFAVNAAVDVGLLGTAGGAEVDAAQLFDGQPLNPLWAARVGVSHAFDFVHGGGGGGDTDTFARVEGCVKDDAGPVNDAVVVVTVDGQAGPRFVVDDKGCFSAPTKAPSGDASWTVTAASPRHAAVSASATAGAAVQLTLVRTPQRGRIAGYATTKEDEPIEVALFVGEGGSAWRAAGSTVGGAFDVDVAAGVVYVVAKADGYLTQATRLHVDTGGRETRTFVMRKVPKKRSASLTAAKIETTARVPFEFKKPRLQSTAEYILDEVVDLLLTHPELRLSIEVHTDASELADPSEAKTLTEARATTVRDALVERGVDPTRLETAGYGLTQPLAQNDPKNRRVEFLILK